MPLPRKILFATDFSEFCDEGLHYATELAKSAGAHLIITHVEEVGRYQGEAQLYEGLPHQGPPAKDQLEALTPHDAGVQFERQLLQGKPADEIVRFATNEGVDLIVIGTHGRRGFRRWMLGSVAEEVVRKADCNVLTVRRKNGEQ